MNTDVEMIQPESPVSEAAKKMKLLDVGALPVCDGRRLLGMITDRDITVRATAEGRNPDATLVRDCMSPEILYCFEDEDAKQADPPLTRSHAGETTHRHCFTWRSRH